jgi:hypothetical protein
MHTWGELFERAEPFETDVESIRNVLAGHRDGEGEP